MEGFDAKQTRVKIKEAEVEFEFEKTLMRRKFRIVKKTGNDLMVLGMPWLQQINPDIDWHKRTVTLRKTASKDLRRSETPALHTDNVKKMSTKTSHEKNEDPTGRKRGGYGGDQVNHEERKYQQELQETRMKLPDELKEYAEVFCQRK
jgi:hypothetical protein